MNSRVPGSAFRDYGTLDLGLGGDGPLAGLTFGVKDLFDVAGVPTGAGSPEWLATHPVPTQTAPAVQRLLEAGARLVGKTCTDEIAWSLAGQNHHYGTPLNPAAPDRIPGGSSSGSASATAAGLVDFAVGSDTGGSVRLPASFCGLFGMRPTHGRIPIDGAVPLAPSFDSVGWFARQGRLFARIGTVLLADAGALALPTRLLIAEDMFALAGVRVRDALGPALALVESRLGPAEPMDLAGGQVAAWRNAFRLIQSAEAWACHGAWVEATRPAFGPGVRERFAAAASLDRAEVEAARHLRGAIRARLDGLIPPGTVVLVPTAPGIAPLLTAGEVELEVFRAKALELLSPAGHAGLPQICLPLARLDGCPAWPFARRGPRSGRSVAGCRRSGVGRGRCRAVERANLERVRLWRIRSRLSRTPAGAVVSQELFNNDGTHTFTVGHA